METGQGLTDLDYMHRKSIRAVLLYRAASAVLRFVVDSQIQPVSLTRIASPRLTRHRVSDRSGLISSRPPGSKTCSA